MNFDKLVPWVAGVVMMFAGAGHLDDLQRWIWRAQARVLYESRTATWGSPNIFIDHSRHVGRLPKRNRTSESEIIGR